MPFLILPLLLVLVVILIPVLLPFTIVQRYRAGVARRIARPWVAGVNCIGTGISAAVFVTSAAFTNIWVPHALQYSLLGIAAGTVLGLAGLWLTRWETAEGALQYTPNRWLILAVTLIVAARILFGFWRMWRVWHEADDVHSWVRLAGIADSMGAGAVVLGYYLSYWPGVWIAIRMRLRR